MTRRLIITLTASAALVAGFSGNALAGDAFGQHVAMCAQMTLGQRDNPPWVTCTHDGVSITFANFGAMVRHMRTEGC